MTDAGDRLIKAALQARAKALAEQFEQLDKEKAEAQRDLERMRRQQVWGLWIQSAGYIGFLSFYFWKLWLRS